MENNGFFLNLSVSPPTRYLRIHFKCLRVSTSVHLLQMLMSLLSVWRWKVCCKFLCIDLASQLVFIPFSIFSKLTFQKYALLVIISHLLLNACSQVLNCYRDHCISFLSGIAHHSEKKKGKKKPVKSSQR